MSVHALEYVILRCRCPLKREPSNNRHNNRNVEPDLSALIRRVTRMRVIFSPDRAIHSHTKDTCVQVHEHVKRPIVFELVQPVQCCGVEHACVCVYVHG